MTGLSPDAQKAVEDSQPAASGEATGDAGRVSLDKSLDRHDRMELVDDETGETELVCKRIPQMGTKFKKKVCATPDEWAYMRNEAKQRTGEIQRPSGSREQ